MAQESGKKKTPQAVVKVVKKRLKLVKQILWVSEEIEIWAWTWAQAQVQAQNSISSEKELN